MSKDLSPAETASNVNFIDDSVWRLLSQAFTTTQDALAVVDAQGRVLDGNPALMSLLGVPRSAVVGQALTSWLDLAVLPQHPWQGEAVLHGGQVGGEEPVPVEITVAWVGPEHRAGPGGVIRVRDVTERHRRARQLEQLALTDSVTGLGNRAHLEQHLAALVRLSPRQRFALLFVDLDGFKVVNDSMGHRSGDEALRGVAHRLRRCLPDAFIARWGGDEFVIVLPPGSDEAAVRECAQLTIATLAQPLPLGLNQEALIRPSIGAAQFPQDADDVPTLLRRADTAMFSAKDLGKNCLVFYEPSLEAGAMRRVRLQGLLRIDAERSAFQFVTQPKVNRAGHMVGAELLMRWQTREFGPVSPAEFIPIAEQTGVIELLGRQALHTAARLARQVQSLGSTVTLAVNLSPRQLQDASFERLALHACERYGVAPSQLELELTESALASGIDVVAPLLQRLHRHGFTLSLDDFGTGYSSLSHLLNLPFHKVKIDRAFVKDLLDNERAQVLIRGTLQICRGLGLKTVAEGVETQAQFDLLRELGVDEFQGYLFARPMDLQAWLASLPAAALPAVAADPSAGPGCV